MTQLRPWQLSLSLHIALIALFTLMTQFQMRSTEVIEVPIEMNMPQDVQNLVESKSTPKVVLKSVNQAEESPPPAKVREVFGVNRQSYTDNSVGDSEAVYAKRGNTLTKESDNKILNADDVDSLPVPTEEYLVSEMPVVLKEVRPSYPQKAREEKIEGVVVLDVLIDKNGLVRQVSVIEGPQIFQKNAVEAMRSFQFKPANIDGSPVPVRIRYTLRFELEY